jgi:anti-anti-sigma factor
MVEYDASEKRGDRGYLRLRGELLGDRSSEEFKRLLEAHYVDDGVRWIVVDLSGVSHISLEGVGILLSLERESERRGKRLIVENPTDLVRDKLQVTGVASTLGVA